jgi:succinate dehydrogenase / fumarate reductase membrane anchor subunit
VVVVNLRSPLRSVLGSGSAKEGTGHWWAQRVTAAALIILGGWFLLALTHSTAVDQGTVNLWIARPWNSVMLLLLGVTLAYHSSLGMQVVIEDYVHGPFVKVVSLILNKFFHAAIAMAAVFAVLKIAFGAS